VAEASRLRRWVRLNGGEFTQENLKLEVRTLSFEPRKEAAQAFLDSTFNVLTSNFGFSSVNSKQKAIGVRPKRR
jgi:hypothetical protein